jgi:hypothetical protein
VRKLNLKDFFNAVRLVNKVGVQSIMEQVTMIRERVKADKESGVTVTKEGVGMEFAQVLLGCMENAEVETYAFIQNFIEDGTKAEELPIEELIKMYHEFMEVNTQGEVVDFFKKASDSIAPTHT